MGRTRFHGLPATLCLIQLSTRKSSARDEFLWHVVIDRSTGFRGLRSLEPKGTVDEGIVVLAEVPNIPLGVGYPALVFRLRRLR